VGGLQSSGRLLAIHLSDEKRESQFVFLPEATAQDFELRDIVFSMIF
jgi:hypothetical protein